MNNNEINQACILAGRAMMDELAPYWKQAGCTDEDICTRVLPAITDTFNTLATRHPLGHVLCIVDGLVLFLEGLVKQIGIPPEHPLECGCAECTKSSPSPSNN